VLLHHPPFDTGIRFMDEVGLITGREALADIIARHRQVKLLLSGHLHRSIHTIAGGCRALTCPSTAHQIPLDLRPDAPEGFCLEPPGFMARNYGVQTPAVSLVAHVVYGTVIAVFMNLAG